MDKSLFLFFVEYQYFTKHNKYVLKIGRNIALYGLSWTYWDRRCNTTQVKSKYR